MRIRCRVSWEVAVRRLNRAFVGRGASLTFALFGTVGCTTKFGDTEGRHYEAECETRPDGTPHCTIRGVAGAPGELDRNGRYLAICDQANDPFSCRPVTCEAEATCQALGGEEFKCVERRCTASSRSTTSGDRVSACLAGTGPYQRTPEQLERITLARACTGNCVLPAACMPIGPRDR